MDLQTSLFQLLRNMRSPNGSLYIIVIIDDKDKKFNLFSLRPLHAKSENIFGSRVNCEMKVLYENCTNNAI